MIKLEGPLNVPKKNSNFFLLELVSEKFLERGMWKEKFGGVALGVQDFWKFWPLELKLENFIKTSM